MKQKYRNDKNANKPCLHIHRANLHRMLYFNEVECQQRKPDHPFQYL